MTVYEIDNYKPVIAPSAFIAPGAFVIGQAVIGAESSVWFNSVIRADCEKIIIGSGSNIQDQTTCHADFGLPLTIGDGVTIGHNSVIHGCTIEDDCLIGMGVTIMNGAVIRKGCLIAAGTLILEGTVVPENSLVTGSPGVIKKKLSPESSAMVRASAEVYRERAKAYADSQNFKHFK